jgi:hypothetical protein
MPVYPLFRHSAFEPDTIDAMEAAFEAALRELGVSDRADPRAETVAKRIIELVQRGERDPERLRERAVGSLRG